MWKIKKKLLFLFLFLGGIIDNWVDFMKKRNCFKYEVFFLKLENIWINWKYLFIYFFYVFIGMYVR